MIIIFKTILAYITLMFIGQSIIGFLLSGLYVPDRIETDIDVINEIQDKHESRNHIFNFLTVIVLIIYLYALNYYWNIYLSLYSNSTIL